MDIDANAVEQTFELSNDLMRGASAPSERGLSVSRAILAAASGRYEHGAPSEFSAWGTAMAIHNDLKSISDASET